jgi:hypothetical protein
MGAQTGLVAEPGERKRPTFPTVEELEKPEEMIVSSGIVVRRTR